jgi:hypothetical protein
MGSKKLRIMACVNAMQIAIGDVKIVKFVKLREHDMDLV